MYQVLDVTPLRSFVAVADCGGFQKAANSIHLSQAAVSQHVKRLEAALGRSLMERKGRGSSFTPDGQRLLQQARRILELHDETLRLFDVEQEHELVIGATEHAAARLLPELRRALSETMPHRQLHFRVDRGSQLRDDLAKGRVDLALLFASSSNPNATPVGWLELTWYSASDWFLPSVPSPLPLVAFDDPCALRSRAIETLASNRISTDVICEAPHLAGVQAAVRAGLGVALMATLGRDSDGLIAREDLPSPEPLELSLWSRQGLDVAVTEGIANVLQQLLAGFALRELSLR
jgi:DNA-binding transcriptional LysR family regulator